VILRHVSIRGQQAERLMLPSKPKPKKGSPI
jgi:hypothetical protein